jgi:hypothetical protein
MVRTPLIALVAALVLIACASSAVRYVGADGKEYPGAVDPLTNSMTAQIANKMYRGPYRVNEWGQAKSTLTAAGVDPLYCDFQYQALKLKGTCTDLAGGEYTVQTR